MPCLLAHGSGLGWHNVQAHELPDAEHPEAGPFERAERGPDERFRLRPAQELRPFGGIVPALQPYRAASSVATRFHRPAAKTIAQSRFSMRAHR